MTSGKRFENQFQRWMKELRVYCQRFYDARSMGRLDAPSRPADFWIYLKSQLILVELKDYNINRRIPLSAIRPSQIKGMQEGLKHDILYFLLVKLNDTLFIIELKALIPSFEDDKVKSLSYDWFKDNATHIVKKRDLLAFFTNPKLNKSFIKGYKVFG